MAIVRSRGALNFGDPIHYRDLAFDHTAARILSTLHLQTGPDSLLDYAGRQAAFATIYAFFGVRVFDWWVRDQFGHRTVSRMAGTGFLFRSDSAFQASCVDCRERRIFPDGADRFGPGFLSADCCIDYRHVALAGVTDRCRLRFDGKYETRLPN